MSRAPARLLSDAKRRASFLFWLLVPLAGCGGTNNPPPDLGVLDAQVVDLATPPPLCDDAQQGDAGIAPSFANVQKVFDQNCIGCHCCNDALELTLGASYAHLVNVSIAQENGVDESCGGTLVTPGNPGQSYLYQKITTDQPCAGRRMPLSELSPTPLPACEQDLVRRWIVAGAPAQ